MRQLLGRRRELDGPPVPPELDHRRRAPEFGRRYGSYRKDSKLPISPQGPVQYPSQRQIDEALDTSYQYQELRHNDDLRLIRVNLSHGDSGHINCDFEHFPMGELVGNHTYEAISYVWGSSSLVEKVLCDDCTSHLEVTHSLLGVLDTLVQLPPGPAGRRKYWIDGLCINQRDPLERSTQVRNMANIYRRAARVHIFLGVLDSPQSNLLESKWFTRRWIIQEAIAAQKVVLHFKKQGVWQYLNGWDALASETIHGSVVVHPDSELRPAAKFLGDLLDTTRTRWSGIFGLLLKFHSAQCADDRDRLFALLGVANDVELADQPGHVPVYMAQFQTMKIWFKPDYSLDTERTFRDFALAALRSPFAFDLLHCAGAFRQRHGDTSRILPTWVPDWRCPLLFKPLMRACDFRAGMSKSLSKEDILVDNSSNSIRIKGILLGTVEALLGGFSGPDDFPERDIFVRVDWSSRVVLRDNRVRIRLTSGLTAVVPTDVDVGDEVVTFIGARTPFVLRRNGGNDNGLVCHSLLGDCYVFGDGIMNGEALHRKDASRALTEFFVV